jgi:hypothetical protein
MQIIPSMANLYISVALMSQILDSTECEVILSKRRNFAKLPDFSPENEFLLKGF